MKFSELQINHWKLIYKDLDVDGELSRMKAWLDANPSRCKKNYKRFVVNWLNRSQWQFTEAQMKQAENYRNAKVGKGPSTPSADPIWMMLVEKAIEESKRTGRSADDILAESKRSYQQLN